MSTNQLPQQKELESAISELRVFMDITAVSLHEANTAGKSGYILTIILEEESDEIASEMYDWADKIFKRHFEITYRIINIIDLIDYIKRGNLYYIKWYLAGIHLFKGDGFEEKMNNELPKAQNLLEKAIQHFTSRIAKAEALQRGAQHYAGTNNHLLALFTIHQNITHLFAVAEELVMGRVYLNNNISHHQETIKDFAPQFAKFFDRSNDEDVQMMVLLHKAHRDFSYSDKMKIKKEIVTTAYKKMQQFLKQVKKVCKEQLSYCHDKLLTFKEPVKAESYSKVIVLSDESIITGIITSYIKTKAIYCFGKHASNINHYYLLVLEEEHKENAVNDLATIIKSKTKGKCTATLLIHSMSDIRTKHPDQQYFFWNVIKNGELLFTDKESYLLDLQQTPKRNYESAKEYLRWRNVIVNYMEGWQDDYEWALYAPLKGVMLR